MTKAYLNQPKSRLQRIQDGNPWVFGNEIKRLEGSVQPGQMVEVFSADKKYLGTGFINPVSQIAIRIVSRQREEKVDAALITRRIREAWSYRQKLGYIENCRLIFGEADMLPGLIVDKFNDYLVIQTLALGIDLWKPVILEALQEIFHPLGIFERNDVAVRQLEGLPLQKGFLSAPFDPLILVKENGLKMQINVETGQKTGYFLDQQDNRRAIAPIVRDAEVLGAFCYTGSFELHAGMYGARSVLGLDISPDAVAFANRNAALNGLESIVGFEALNAFDALKKWGKEGKSFDVVMLDPPSFAKSRSAIQKALSGYKEINLRAMKLVRPGGFLVSSSCTNLVTPPAFLQMIWDAARDAKRMVRQVTFQTQSGDHPILPCLESTQYLKFLICQVC